MTTEDSIPEKNYDTNNKYFFLSSTSISVLAVTIMSFVINYSIIKEYGSTAILGTILSIATFITVFFNLFFGAYIDTRNKKITMLSLNCISGVLCILSWLVMSQAFNLFYIAGFVLCTQILSVSYSITYKASVPKFFNKEQILNVNTSITLITKISKVAGPALASMAILYFAYDLFFLIAGIPVFVSCLNKKSA